ncbi:MAG: NAD(P)/FAD-dependent oxidoreductase [Rubrivivax sp.]|nr:NAD(P)/FAD-dependent oxidoreductase [Rubrivivax sp.]
MDRIDVLVIGAGVVGLAVARALARQGREVWIAEREGGIGAGVSSRNSEVVHAGLYYPAGSLKARLCVRGKQLLYAYCAERGVPARRCGKLVVAVTAAELPRLRALQAQALANGVADLQWLDGDAARALEPALRCEAALWSPSSGIVDSHALMLALLGDAEASGATLALHSRFAGATPVAGGWRVRVVAEGGAGDAAEFETRCIVNAAGLGAQAVAAAMDGFPADAVPRRHLAKGHYFSLAGRAPFSRLIYPLPTDGGLGVHLTLDLGGQAKFGPDVQWLAAGDEVDDRLLDYRVDEQRAAAFADAVRTWWPALPADALQPAYAGIRPKLSGPGAAAADFHIAGPAQHGCAGVVHLFGIESPGLTSALAIAETVSALVDADRPARPTDGGLAAANSAAAAGAAMSPFVPPNPSGDRR